MRRGNAKVRDADKDFVPESWKSEYPNAAFSRMTDRDAAWMASILARFTPEMVHRLAVIGNFTDPGDTEYIASMMEGRLEKILDRYRTRLSPAADLHIEGGDALCGLDLAEMRHLREPDAYRHVVTVKSGTILPVERGAAGRVCTRLPHRARDDGAGDGSAERYTTVKIADGVAQGPLVAYLYDLGPARGFRLAGLERPEP